MLDHIKSSAWLLPIVSTIVIFIAGVAVVRYKVDELVESSSRASAHMSDSARHLDPLRDPITASEINRRLDNIERRIQWIERQAWLRAVDNDTPTHRRDQ